MATVKKGDVVKKGDILIGGWMEGKYTGTRYLHARGDVQARIWYTATEKVSLKEMKKEKTGNEENKYKIKINNFEINFYKTLSKFEKYDTIYETQKVKIFSDFYIPVELIKCNNFETIEKEQNYTKEQAKEIAIKKAQEKLNSQITSVENIVF